MLDILACVFLKTTFYTNVWVFSWMFSIIYGDSMYHNNKKKNFHFYIITILKRQYLPQVFII